MGLAIWVTMYVRPPFDRNLWGHILHCGTCGMEWKRQLGTSDLRLACPRCLTGEAQSEILAAWRVALANSAPSTPEKPETPHAR